MYLAKLARSIPSMVSDCQMINEMVVRSAELLAVGQRVASRLAVFLLLLHLPITPTNVNGRSAGLAGKISTLRGSDIRCRRLVLRIFA